MVGKILSVHVTCANRKEAEKIGETVVREKLAACANIHETFSIYEWKGKTQKHKEWVLVLKTAESAYGKLERRIKQMHSYEVPSIVAFRAEKAEKKYEKWVRKSAKPT